MYWYNPTTHTSERVDTPSGEEEAIRMLAGHSDSAAFVGEYAELRRSGAPIERALVSVGHEERLREHECTPMRLAAHERPRRRGGRVPTGTSCCWRYAFERKARIAKRGSASGRGHDAKLRLRASDNAPSAHSGE